MPFTYNVANDIGKVRLLCTDRDAANPIFEEDDEIQVFLDLMGGNLLRAAAMALLTIAAEETLLMKRIKLLDLHTDGPAEAAALRELAAVYQEKADLAEAAEVDGTFDYAEMVYDEFTARERLEKEALRSG